MKDITLADMTIKDLIEICEKSGADTYKVTIKICNPEENWICTFEMNSKEKKC